MADVVDRLKAALADRYAIERELGAGGMATVYLAGDLKHDRNVAVKVLKPELAQALGAERFLREIKTTANLRHPHILPLYDSGEAGGFLYYVMPLVEGESLRDRLEREKQLPLDDALQIAREVADALAYAHSRDVVHRDIKPENILLESGHAVVADFGIARAISEAGGETLTQTGLAVGTPAYMSPEQAAGGTEVDGRSDVYSLACVTYEMLGGEPPFTGPTAESLVHQHMTAEPSLVTNLRPGVPDNIVGALARALAKTPADRFSPATQFAEAMTPTLQLVESAARRGHPLRVLGLFALASVAVLGVVYFLMMQLGLPAWVIPGAIALLAAGLPIMIVTGQVEKRRALSRARGQTHLQREGVMQALFTWRRATLGGVLAFAGLGVVTLAYGTMRVLGIGSVGTLMATGVLDERGQLIVAEFENGTSDSTLGTTVTEALRIDLAQSPVVTLMGAREIAAALTRMQRDALDVLDAATALELAEREGVRAVVAGEIRTLGSGFVFAARVISSTNGAELVALRESAADEGEIIAAVDRLSAKLRERIGESLKTIRRTEPLMQVTTGSIEALRKYSEAYRAEGVGAVEQAAALYREAIALDSLFAMAHRKLAVQLYNAGDRAGAAAAATASYRHRDRLPAHERHQAVAFYHLTVDWDYDAMVRAYRAALESDPHDESALNNLSFLLQWTRRFAEAESLALKGTQVTNASVVWETLIQAQVNQGKFDRAYETLGKLREKVPANPHSFFIEQSLAVASRQWDAMEAVSDSLRAREPGYYMAYYSELTQGAADEVRGKLASARGHLVRYRAIVEEAGLPGRSVIGAIRLGLLELRYGGDPAAVGQSVDRAIDELSWSSIPVPDRPYPELIYFYSESGQLSRAAQFREEYEAIVPAGVRRGHVFHHAGLGALARAEGRHQDAIAAFRAWYEAGDDECPHCPWYELGATYDAVGEADSAVASFAQAVDVPSYLGVLKEHGFLTLTHRRLGELYEGRGEREKAVEHYNKFLDFWQDADAELQPQVEEVRERLGRLVGN